MKLRFLERKTEFSQRAAFASLLVLIFIFYSGCLRIIQPNLETDLAAIGLQTPTGLSAATFSTTQLDVSWVDHSTAEVQFELERSTTAGSGYGLIATLTPNATSHSDTGLSSNTTYYYRLRGVNALGQSAYAEGNGTTLPTAPTVPAATANGDGQIDVSWTAPVGTATLTHYTVKRAAVSGGPYTNISTPTSTNYPNTGLTNATVYYYVVSATNAGGESVNSAEVTSSPIAAPTTLAAAYASDTQNNLSWTDNSSNETGFKIERSTTSGASFAQIGTAAANATTYNDATAVAGNKYYYRVRAYHATGNSAYTSEASIPAPTITSTVYLSATSAGGPVYSITGTGFRASTVLKINSTTVTPSAINATSATFTSPSAAAVGATAIGRYDLVVYNPDTQTAAFTNGFTFVGSPRLWLRADAGVLNGAAAAAANGDVVGTWTDQSGNGRTATQATGGQQPTFSTNQFNGLPALVFDGATTWMNMTATSANIVNGLTAFTSIMVNAFTDATLKDERIFQTTTNGSGTVTRLALLKSVGSGNYAIKMRDSADAAGSTLDSSIGVNNLALHVSTFNVDFSASNPRAIAYFDGTLSTSLNTTSTTGFDATDSASVVLGRLGTSTNASFYYNGKITELLFYGSSLNTADQQSIEGHLSNKYGL